MALSALALLAARRWHALPASGFRPPGRSGKTPGPRLRPPYASCGFTLLELLVVIALIAVASAGVVMSMGDGSQDALQREAQRLAAQLDAARAQSRASGQPAYWHADSNGFAIDGLPGGTRSAAWLLPPVAVRASGDIALGPEPLIGPQSIAIAYPGRAAQALVVATDGVRPFAVQDMP